MQQNLKINIVDPSAPVADLPVGDSSAPVGDLPITADSLFSFLSNYFSTANWPVILLLVIAGAVCLSVFSAKYSRGAKLRVARFSLLTILPLFALVGVLAATNPTNQVVSAPASLSLSKVDNVELNVDIGTTSASNSFTYAIAAGSWTEGYNLYAKATTSLPNGVSVSIEDQSISSASTEIVRRHRSTLPDSEHLTVVVTVPEDLPLQDNYATITLDYSAADYYQHYGTGNDVEGGAVLFDAAACAALPTYDGSNITPGVNPSNPQHTMVFTDYRNGQNYRIRKFPDNHCWMIDNLKLANYNATTADSDGTLNIPAALTTGTGVDTAPQVWDAAAACAGASVSTAFLGQVTYIYDPNSPTGCGYLYNWCAATADNSAGCATTYSKSYNENMNTSICPKGWKLPREGANGATNNEFAALDTAMKSAGSGYVTDHKNWWPNGAFAGALSGYFTPENNKYFDQQGTVAWYWSAAGTTQPGGYAFALTFNHTTVLAAVASGYNFKYDGFAVRCFI